MTRNQPKSVTATITTVDRGRTLIALDDGAWSALGLGIGDRCMVEAGDDVAAGEITSVRVVSLALGLGAPGARVRVRAPRLESFATAQAVQP